MIYISALGIVKLQKCCSFRTILLTYMFFEYLLCVTHCAKYRKGHSQEKD